MDTYSSYIEKRKKPRAQLEIPIEIKPIDTSSQSFRAKTADISESGIKLASKDSLRLPEAIILSLNIPFPPYVVELPSKTIWSRPSGRHLLPFCGVQFGELKREQGINLKRLLWLCDSFIEKNIENLLEKANDVNARTGEKVRNFFKKDVKSYLNILCQIQSEIDKEILAENDSQVKIDSISHGIARRGEKFEEAINNKLITKEVKKKFREIIDSWAYESEIMRRGFEKPRGYPGDYKTLELIYDNKEITDGVGRYFDRIFLDNPYAKAVRSRKVEMFEILCNFFKNCTLESVNMLNLASGSCREIKELFEKEFKYQGNVTITCVDHDEEALDFAKDLLSDLPCNVKLQFVKANILKFSEKSEHYSKLLGKQNFIYSIGLIDYLPDRILKRLLKFCITLLVPKGQLILTHKDIDKDAYAPVFPDWFCDWKFTTRNGEDLVNIVKDSMVSNDFTIKTARDKTEKIIFLFAEKKA